MSGTKSLSNLEVQTLTLPASLMASPHPLALSPSLNSHGRKDLPAFSFSFFIFL